MILNDNSFLKGLLLTAMSKHEGAGGGSGGSGGTSSNSGAEKVTPAPSAASK